MCCMIRARPLILAVAAVVAVASASAQGPDFVKDIAPIFEAKCLKCHGGEKQKSGYRLDVKRIALTGGDEHAPNIVPGKSAESPLVKFVAGLDPDVKMPPKGERLSAEEIAVLREWIDAGAEWPDIASAKGADPLDWWSLKPLVKTENSIDGFISKKLGEHGLAMSPEADARTRCRRLYFDLTGLPPTPEEMDAFAHESHGSHESHATYEALVDKLLASPRHGERWARHWLDVVHYGDTHGYDKDQPRPNAWPYRDYVIRAFNDDKPYARFVQEQLAGDVLFPGTRDGMEALGFISAGPWDFIGHAELPEEKIDGKVARHLDRDDMVGNAIGTFTSTTVQCAQCHNHKFDPISQEDYYSLQAVFAALDRADKIYDLDPAVAAKRAELSARKVELDVTDKGLAEQVAKELAALPPPQVVYAGTAFSGSGNFRGTGGKPRPIHLLARGQVTTPGSEVFPGTLSALGKLMPARFDLAPDAPEGARRAALARWIIAPENPLTWRSIVNRVWQYHFGRGLVETANDFGKMGALPTHPELLDWLAVTFRDDMGGSLKKLHKVIVMSAAYRQSSTFQNEKAAQIDTGNTLLWRANRRKLEAEAVRDAVLAVSGKLDLTPGGPGWQDFVIEHPEHSPHYEYGKADPEDARTWRRSIYRFIVRSQMQPFMTSLDCADPSMRVEKRNESVSPAQALALLNNAFMVAQSAHFAERLEKEASGDLPAQIERAYRLAFGRSPTAVENEKLVAFAQQNGLSNLCRAILNLNEFTFVD